MINNLELIKPLLVFESEDDFYHLQIIKRKKEHKDLGSNSYIVKTYYISSINYLDNKMSEIISLCNFHNARAGINLNKRSFEKLAFHLLKKVTDQIMNRDYKSTRKAYESVCGTYSNEGKKKWIIDIDIKDLNLISNIRADIRNCTPDTKKDKVLSILETKNGYHLITEPFNLQEFFSLWKDIEVHKDNPTILYIS